MKRLWGSGLAILLLCGAPWLAMAAPGYFEAHKMYADLDIAMDKMVVAAPDCNAAGKRANDSAAIWRKMKKQGMTKDGWWKKAKFGDAQEHEIETLHIAVRAKYRTSLGAVLLKCPEKSVKDALAEYEKN